MSVTFAFNTCNCLSINYVVTDQGQQNFFLLIVQIILHRKGVCFLFYNKKQCVIKNLTIKFFGKVNQLILSVMFVSKCCRKGLAKFTFIRGRSRKARGTHFFWAASKRVIFIFLYLLEAGHMRFLMKTFKFLWWVHTSFPYTERSDPASTYIRNVNSDWIISINRKIIEKHFYPKYWLGRGRNIFWVWLRKGQWFFIIITEAEHTFVINFKMVSD